MANFSTNQVRQLYVVGAVKNTTALTTAAGDVSVSKTADGTKMFFTYMGKGGMTRSDLVPIKNILFAKTAKHEDMIIPRQQLNVVLDSTINSGNPVAGQDYIMHLNMRGLFNQSEDFDYIKVFAVHATTGMTASNFYKTLALNIVKGFKRELNKPVEVQLTTSGDPVTVTESTDPTDLDGTYTGINLRNVDNDWYRGTFVEARPELVVSFSPITYSGIEYDTWGVVTSSTFNLDSDKNGRTVADLETFAMGERGDQYRLMGWPNVVPTEYFVDPTQNYEMITIHYAFIDSNEGVQKSEKDIQFAGSKAVINALVGKINTATGASEGDVAYLATLA